MPASMRLGEAIIGKQELRRWNFTRNAFGRVRRTARIGVAVIETVTIDDASVSDGRIANASRISLAIRGCLQAGMTAGVQL